MNQSIKSKELSFHRVLEPGQIYRTDNEFVNTFTSTSFDLATTGEVKFVVNAGKYNEVGDYVERNTKTVSGFYTKTINTVSDFIFLTFENTSTTAQTIFIQTIHSFIKQVNSVGRQHKVIDNTANVTLTKPTSEFNLDLIRGLYEKQEAVDIYGSALGTSTTRHVLWDDENSNVYDGLSVGVSVVVQCSSLLDADGSDGAQIIKLTGLNSSFTQITEDITLNGVSVQGVCPFMRVNSAEVTQAGASLFNVGDITIHPYFDTSLTLERIEAEQSLSNTFHFTVPKDKTLVIDSIDLHGVIEDPSFFYVTSTGVSSTVEPYDGTPNLQTTLMTSAVANGEWSININRKFETGKTIKLDISTDPAHPVHLGTNRFYATTEGKLITNTF
jgi:hypothetical protein